METTANISMRERMESISELVASVGGKINGLGKYQKLGVIVRMM